MKLSLATLVTLLFASGEVYAHGIERSMHPREISARQLAANKRHIQARNCAPQIAEYHRKRRIAKRNLLKKKRDTTFPYTTLAVEPQETTIRNTTCVTAPEVTEGPYYLNNDLIRQDLREDQGGILLELDIGVIDTSTCEPLPNALVEIWNCNATGSYSGFTTAGGTGGGQTPGGGNNSSMSFSLDPSQTGGGAPPSGSDGAVPSGTGGTGPGNGGGGSGGSTKTDGYNFLRGGWQTNDAGIVAFKTIYPGFYTGRTVHIHTMVHQNITYNSNGTYTSKSGSLVHVGQMFFDDALNDQVMALSPYSDTSMTRMYNTEDSILAQENSNGYSAYVDASLIDENDVSQGVLGFITIGVNSEATYSVSSNNYFTGDLVESVSPDSTDSVIISSSTASESTTSVAEDTTSTTESTSTIESTSTTQSTSVTQSLPAQSPPSQSQPGQPHHGQPNPGQPNPGQPNAVQSHPAQSPPAQSPPSRGFHKRRSPRY